MVDIEASSAGAQVYRPRSAKDWEEKKAYIKQLYWIEGKDLPTVIRMMRDRHAFLATTRQYKHHLQRWGLEKNIKAADKKHIIRIARRRLLEENKKTEFYVKERLVTSGRVESWMNTSALEDQSSSDVARPTTPPYILYHTPPPSNDSPSPPNLQLNSPPPTPGDGQAPEAAAVATQARGRSLSQPQILPPTEPPTRRPSLAEIRTDRAAPRAASSSWNLPGSRELFLNNSYAASIDTAIIGNLLDICVKRTCPLRHEDRGRSSPDARPDMRTCGLCACAGCRINHLKCERNPDDPLGPCLACVKSHRLLYRQTISLSWWKLSDIVLFVEQQEQYDIPRYPIAALSNPLNDCSKVFISSDLPEPGDEDHPFMLKLTPGDHESFKRLLHVTVSENPATASENTPDYLHEEAELIARGLKAYVDRSVGLYISSLISKLDDVIWRTYLIAYKHVTDAQTSRERALMINTFRLWITCINSNRELDVVVDNRFDDKYGPATVARASERHGPDVVVRHDLFSQLRVVLRQKLLCPWSKAIMTELDALIRSGKREYWFTIYLVSFILLHGAAMLTEADHELAGRVGISGDYARPMTILKYHEGMRTLLAYYHLSDQTFRPFQLALSAQGLESLAQTAGLNPDQAEHVRWTANAMKEREQTNRRSREERQYADPYYWISQLFDDRRI